MPVIWVCLGELPNHSVDWSIVQGIFGRSPSFNTHRPISPNTELVHLVGTTHDLLVLFVELHGRPADFVSSVL